MVASGRGLFLQISVNVADNVVAVRQRPVVMFSEWRHAVMSGGEDHLAVADHFSHFLQRSMGENTDMPPLQFAGIDARHARFEV